MGGTSSKKYNILIPSDIATMISDFEKIKIDSKGLLGFLNENFEDNTLVDEVRKRLMSDKYKIKDTMITHDKKKKEITFAFIFYFVDGRCRVWRKFKINY